MSDQLGAYYEYVAAVILGVVEGLTEFLPISSTGHLILVGKRIGFVGDKAETFEIFIQLGAILAVVWLYFDKFLNLLRFKKESTPAAPTDGYQNNFSGLQGIIIMALSCLPIFILGFLLGRTIKDLLFNEPSVALSLITGGVLMIAAEKTFKTPKVFSINEITIKHAFLIGLFQCCALWPGFSRSASTIIGGLLLGIHRTAAAEFSFLIAVPVITVAALHDLKENIGLLSLSDLPVFAIGFFVSFIVAIVAIKSFIAFLKRFDMVPFAFYRIALGSLVLLLYFFQ